MVEREGGLLNQLVNKGLDFGAPLLVTVITVLALDRLLESCLEMGHENGEN